MHSAHNLGGRPPLISEKRLWVAHPCGFCKGGVFLFYLFEFLFSSWPLDQPFLIPCFLQSLPECYGGNPRRRRVAAKGGPLLSEAIPALFFQLVEPGIFLLFPFFRG